jgi:hypothetical protein
MQFRALVWGCVLVMSGGCALDFDPFRSRLRDIDAYSDGDAVVVKLDVPSSDITKDTTHDIASDYSDSGVYDARIDRPLCSPGTSSQARFRFAHMAHDLGVVDLCMRRRSSPLQGFERVVASQWPTSGVGYSQVTVSVPFNTTVSNANEAWEFAVVPYGVSCSQASSRALLTRSLQFDPNVTRLLLLTSERQPSGSISRVLNVLTDEECTDCTNGSGLTLPLVDVRGIHAALGSDDRRINFMLDLPIDPRLIPSDLLSMRTFATGTAYGSESGYACNSLWGAVAALRLPGGVINAQFTATTTSGTAIARSDVVRLKVTQLQQTRLITVFFIGDFTWEGTQIGGDPEFVICYDALSNGSFSNCDRAPARLMSLLTDAGTDAVRGDGSAGTSGDVSTADVSDAGTTGSGLSIDVPSIEPR